MRTDILGHPPSLCNCRRVWHPCHTLLSVFCGQYISAWLVQQRLLHPLRELLCIPCIPWEDTTHPNLLCIPCILWENTTHPNLLCVPWENTHCLLVYSFLVYLKINDYGYAPG